MPQPYIGEIKMFAGNFAPAGWHFCDGTILPISENETLYNLIGTTFGGDGESTFALPNMACRIPIHAGTYQGVTFQTGETAGTEEVTLITNQIPGHTHALMASTSLATGNTPVGNLVAESVSIPIYRQISPSNNLNSATLTPAGSSQPHLNLQPYLCVSYIISLFGIFPSQT